MVPRSISFPVKTPSLFLFSAIASLGIGVLPVQADPPVRVQGIASVSRIFKAAAADLRAMGIEIKIGEDCGNTQALALLGTGEIDFALVGRPLTGEDHAAYPDRPIEEMKVGTQTIAVLISRAVWESGVRALSREQVIELYEGRVETWQQFGGQKRSTKFFEPAHGHGVWETFVIWLYGDLRKAPAVSWEIVADGAQAQTSVEFSNGAASVAAVRWADRREVFPLSIIDESGAAIEPTPENVAVGKYPMSRPAYIVHGKRPAGNRRKILEYLQSEKGRAVIAASDLLPVAPPAPAP
jgi:phosphate transport system substrate-binding protein